MELSDIGERVYAAESLLNRRTRRGKAEYLVKWKGWSIKYSTWEPEDNIIDKRLLESYEKRRKEIEGSTGPKRRGRKRRKSKVDAPIPDVVPRPEPVDVKEEPGDDSDKDESDKDDSDKDDSSDSNPGVDSPCLLPSTSTKPPGTMPARTASIVGQVKRKLAQDSSSSSSSSDDDSDDVGPPILRKEAPIKRLCGGFKAKSIPKVKRKDSSTFKSSTPLSVIAKSVKLTSKAVTLPNTKKKGKKKLKKKKKLPKPNLKNPSPVTRIRIMRKTKKDGTVLRTKRYEHEDGTVTVRRLKPKDKKVKSKPSLKAKKILAAASKNSAPSLKKKKKKLKVKSVNRDVVEAPKKLKMEKKELKVKTKTKVKVKKAKVSTPPAPPPPPPPPPHSLSRHSSTTSSASTSSSSSSSSSSSASPSPQPPSSPQHTSSLVALPVKAEVTAELVSPTKHTAGVKEADFGKLGPIKIVIRSNSRSSEVDEKSPRKDKSPMGHKKDGSLFSPTATMECSLVSPTPDKPIPTIVEHTVSKTSSPPAGDKKVPNKKVAVKTVPVESVKETLKESVKTPSKEPMKTSTKEHIKATPKEPVKIPFKEPMKTTVKEPVKVPFKEPIKATVKEPVKVPLKEPVKDPEINPYDYHDEDECPLVIDEKSDAKENQPAPQKNDVKLTQIKQPCSLNGEKATSIERPSKVVPVPRTDKKSEPKPTVAKDCIKNTSLSMMRSELVPKKINPSKVIPCPKLSPMFPAKLAPKLSPKLCPKPLPKKAAEDPKRKDDKLNKPEANKHIADTAEAFRAKSCPKQANGNTTASEPVVGPNSETKKAPPKPCVKQNNGHLTLAHSFPMKLNAKATITEKTNQLHVKSNPVPQKTSHVNVKPNPALPKPRPVHEKASPVLNTKLSPEIEPNNNVTKVAVKRPSVLTKEAITLHDAARLGKAGAVSKTVINHPDVTPRKTSPHGITSQNITLQNNVSLTTPPRNNTPQNISSRNNISHSITPQNITSRNNISQSIIPQSITSGNNNPQNVASRNTSPQNITARNVPPGSVPPHSIPPPKMKKPNVTAPIPFAQPIRVPVVPKSILTFRAEQRAPSHADSPLDLSLKSPPPPKIKRKLWHPQPEKFEKILVTDVKMRDFTITIRESDTAEGFFNKT